MRGLERIAADRRHLIARQVRCSTGFTWGVAGDVGAVVAGVAPRERATARALRRRAEEAFAASDAPAAGRGDRE